MKAVAYLRTSSAANVGADKDSSTRQRTAIFEYAERCDITIAELFNDEAVSGADPVQDREGFALMLNYLAEAPDVKLVLVENASRFARDLAVQIAGHDLLKQRGITLIPVDAPDYFTDETPTAVMVRHILGAVSEFEKSNLVHKLRVARDRKRKATGKCEGRRSYIELDPDACSLAASWRSKGRSLRWIASALAQEGHHTARGRPFAAAAVSKMINQYRERYGL